MPRPNAEESSLPPDQVRALAEQWFTSQVDRLSSRHAAHWPAVQHWVEDYLRAELRQRLIARGWRVKR